MTTELSIVNGLIAEIQSLSAFANADVVDNDWTLLDQASENAPYVIFEIADDFDAPLVSTASKATWSIPFTLIEVFTDWQTTSQNLRTRRQAIVDHFNSANDGATGGGLDGVMVDRIRSTSPVTPIYEQYLRDDEIPDALPIFLSQRMVFEVEEF